MANRQTIWLTALCCLTGPFLLRGQSDTVISMADQAEWQAVVSESVLTEEEATDQLMSQTGKPVLLNRYREADYLRIPFLTGRQRESLIDYVCRYGDVLSLQELVSVPGFDSALVRKISPWISLEPTPSSPRATPGNLLSGGNYRLLFRYSQSYPLSDAYLINSQESDGDPLYPGNPHRYLFRFTYRFFNLVQLMIGGEKDPGEQFFRGGQPAGMDEYSVSLVLSNGKWLKNLTLGNYRAGFGEGLVMGGGSGLLNSPGFGSSSYRKSGVRGAFVSPDLQVFRGFAATLRAGRFEISPFCSFRWLDGKATGDTSGRGLIVISGFHTDGYHRTPAELERRGNVTEFIAGGNATLSGNAFQVGITGYYRCMNAVTDPGDDVWRQFQFRGRENVAAGIFFRVRVKQLLLFGESAFSLNGGLAGIAGLEVDAVTGIRLTLIGRNYAPAYQNGYSGAFSRSSSPVNEKGLFIRVVIPVVSWINLAAMCDIFRYPWLKYRIDGPSDGYEWAASASGEPNPWLGYEVRYRKLTGKINHREEGAPLNRIIDTALEGLSLRVKCSPSHAWTLKSRLELRRYVDETERSDGFLFQQIVSFRAASFPLKGVLHMEIFESPGWGARIGCYEPGLSGSFSTPVFSGSGMRYGIMAEADISKHLEISASVNLTYYSDRSTIGSGADQTSGNLKGDLGIQIILRR